MALWRIYLRPDRPDWALVDDTFAFCIKRGVLGIGWGLAEGVSGPLTIEDYEMLADREYEGAPHKGWLQAFNAFRAIRPGDFCWTHRPDGHDYYLARVTGEWTYRWERPYTDAGIAQSRDCDWAQAGSEVPPGYPVPEGGTVRRIHDVEAELAALRVWMEVVD